MSVESARDDVDGPQDPRPLEPCAPAIRGVGKANMGLAVRSDNDCFAASLALRYERESVQATILKPAISRAARVIIVV